MITTTDKIHLKCDCVNGSIDNGVREQILFSFILSASPGYQTIKDRNIILYFKRKTTKQDWILIIFSKKSPTITLFNSTPKH